MAETYITEQDRYSTPSVYQGNAYEDVNTRAAANLGTMSGQMTLLKMQELQNSLSMQDMSRRKSIFEEDKRVEQAREADDFAGFMMDQAGAPDAPAKAEEFLSKNPKLFKNDDVMSMLGNMNKSTERINQIRADKMQSRNIGVQEDLQDESEETYRLKVGTALDQAKSEKEGWKSAIYEQGNESLHKIHSLLGASAIDGDTKLNMSNAVSDINSNPNMTPEQKQSMMSVFTRFGGSFSNLAKMEEIEMAKIAKHGNLHKSLGQMGINIDLESAPEDLDKVFTQAMKKAPDRAQAIFDFRKDVMEAKSARSEIGDNKKMFNEKLVKLNDLSTKMAKGDVDAQIEYRRLMDELSVTAGTIDGKVSSVNDAYARQRALMDENMESKTKAARIANIESEIRKETNHAVREQKKMELEGLQKNKGAVQQHINNLYDLMEVETDSTKRAEYLQQIKDNVKSLDPNNTGSTAPTNGNRGQIPRTQPTK
jgi:hypothetical protein